MIDEQYLEYLGSFAVPAELRGRFLTAWHRGKGREVDVVATRRRLDTMRGRVNELFIGATIDRTEYETRTARIADELAGLPRTSGPESEVDPMLMGFLANVSEAWKAATPEKRNLLAWQLFGQVVIANRTAVAVVPRPDLRPSCELIGQEGGTPMPSRMIRNGICTKL